MDDVFVSFILDRFQQFYYVVIRHHDWICEMTVVGSKSSGRYFPAFSPWQAIIRFLIMKTKTSGQNKLQKRFGIVTAL